MTLRRHRVSRKKKRRVAKCVVANRCYWCDRGMVNRNGCGELQRTKDHAHPKHDGGRKTVPCCYQCNQIKGGMLLVDWYHFMADNPDWWNTHKPGPDGLPKMKQLTNEEQS